MKVVRDAIAARLLAMTEVTAQLGTFRGVPAIFSTTPIPPAATGRYIVIRDAFHDTEFASKTPSSPPADYVATEGRIVIHDIGLYEDHTGDSSTLEDLAVFVRDAFNRKPGLLTVSGYGTLIAKATGPIEASGDDELDNQVDGRIVTVELTVIKNPS